MSWTKQGCTQKKFKYPFFICILDKSRGVSMSPQRIQVLYARGVQPKSTLSHILSRKLKDEIEVYEALEFADCTHVLQKHHFDLVLVAEDFSDSKGLDFITDLKKWRPHLPVITVLKSDDIENREIAYSRGATDVLVQSDLNVALVKRAIQLILEKEMATKKMQESSGSNTNLAQLATLGVGAATMAHEINSRLAVVLGNSESIQRMVDLALEGQPEAEMVELEVAKLTKKLESITSSTRRMGKIIRGIRRLSVSATDDDPFEKTELRELIDEAFEMCQSKAKNEGVELILGQVPNNVFLNCRPTQIVQVLVNLVYNGIDAATESEERWVSVGFQQSDAYVGVDIFDSGKGMDSEDLQRLWQPFYTTKKQKKGTGIGLAVSKDIIERHNGELSIDLEQKNTCFSIRLPKYFEKEATSIDESVES
jgi:C4-dicarboxylate-specific signal transduction histidine kinase